MNYPSDFINKVICGDCLEVMKQIPDKSVDLVLTDPPYGIDLAKNGFVCRGGKAPSINYGKQEWDIAIPSKIYFDEMFRISKNQIIFGGNYYTHYLLPTKSWIIWDKIGDGGSRPNNSDCELAWTSLTIPTKKYTWKWRGFIQQNMGLKDIKDHPAQKPLGLIKKILLDFSEENSIILDPFLGSGTTAVACKELGRKFIGIEINPEYCKIANERLRQEVLPL